MNNIKKSNYKPFLIIIFEIDIISSWLYSEFYCSLLNSLIKFKMKLKDIIIHPIDKTNKYG